jgi:hypothetical protein
MGFFVGLLIGIGLGAYLGWSLLKAANTTHVKNVTVKIDKEDLIDLIESDEVVEDLKKQLGFTKDP